LSGDVSELLDRLKGRRVLVVGDLILDRYVSGEVPRISPEAPVPVFRVRAEEAKAGGAANVAANVASLGGRALLEPLFASYGVPANSDYAPLLDLNAARHRFTERSATELVALLNADIPLLEMLEPSRSRRPVNPLFQGAHAFERVENARLAWYARDFLVGPRRPAPESIPTPLQKDLDLVRLRLLECREPREFDSWTHSVLRVAKLLNPHLAPDDAGAVWARIQASPCYPSLRESQREWLQLLRAIAARDAARMADLAERILATQGGLGAEAREYLVMAAMAGRIAAREPQKALQLWNDESSRLRLATPAFRLLRCHAERAGCAAAFSAYAER